MTRQEIHEQKKVAISAMVKSHGFNGNQYEYWRKLLKFRKAVLNA